jgi:large subunit ribosomal protein L6
MSSIGKKPIGIPSGVTVSVSKDNEIVVKGPKGELRQAVDRDIAIEVNDN